MKHTSSALFASFLLCLAISAGCGSPPAEVKPDQNPSFGPHGGPTAVLPEEKGVVEIVQQAGTGQTRLVAYFYSSKAMDSPLSPVPSVVQFTMKMPGGGSQDVTFTVEPKQGEPGGEARFISKPGEYDVDPLIGTVSATIDGQPVTAELSGIIR